MSCAQAARQSTMILPRTSRVITKRAITNSSGLLSARPSRFERGAVAVRLSSLRSVQALQRQRGLLSQASKASHTLVNSKESSSGPSLTTLKEFNTFHPAKEESALWPPEQLRPFKSTADRLHFFVCVRSDIPSVLACILNYNDPKEISKHMFPEIRRKRSVL